jgi:hypothetical protein
MVNGALIIPSLVLFVAVSTPYFFLVYRLLHADRVACNVISFLSVGPISLVSFYIWFYFTDVPGNPESLAHQGTMRLKEFSNMLPSLTLAGSFLIGVALLYTSTVRTWFAVGLGSRGNEGDA